MALVVRLADGGEDRYKYLRGATTRVVYQPYPTPDGGLEVHELHLHLVPATGAWIKQLERGVSYYRPDEWVGYEAGRTAGASFEPPLVTRPVTDVVADRPRSMT